MEVLTVCAAPENVAEKEQPEKTEDDETSE